MSRIEQRKDFLNLVFDQDDKVAWGMGKKFVRARDPYPEFLHTNENMLCINPCTYRDAQHVTNVNSLLFEVDQGLTPKQQIKAFLDSKLPFTTMTYSGNKSIHVIVRFVNPISYENYDKRWQEAWWEAIERALLTKGIKVDQSTKSVAQLSRLPGSLNEKTGKEQRLLLLRKRVTHQEMLQWLEDCGESLIPPQDKPKRQKTYTTEISDHKKYELAKNKNAEKLGMYTSTWTTGGYMWFWTLGTRFYNLNLNLDVGIGLTEIDFGTQFQGQSEGGWIGETATAIEKGYNYAERQNK